MKINKQDLIENSNFLYNLLKPLLGIFLIASLIMFLLNGAFYYSIKVQNDNLENIRYCPNCGVDLLK